MNRNEAMYANNRAAQMERNMRMSHTMPGGAGMPGSRHGMPGNRAGVPEEGACRDFSDIPLGNQQQLLTYIDEVSFCAYDLMLYLDTHPEDEEAWGHFQKYDEKRERAMEIYEDAYGPLRFSQECGCAAGTVQWVNQPWPWEGGEC